MSATIEQRVVDADHPWLGLSPFTEATINYFFGREQETRDVFLRIREQPLTIFFGRSGLGKTSLLGAGVIPKLKVEGFRPYLLRLGYARLDAPLIEQLLQAVEGTLCRTGRDALARDGGPSQTTLWEVFHHLPSRPKDLPESPPVLIFDQFEEIFTLTQTQERRAEADELFSQLADLIENRPPLAVQERLRAERRLARNYDFGSSSVRIVLTLREDFLSNLEAWKKLMPSIMRNRIGLQLLNGPQALSAVVRPGRLEGRDLVSDEVGARIVCFVANRLPGTCLEEINAVPPLLSLLCEGLNDERVKANQQHISTDLVEKHIKNIIPNFYQKVYDGLSRPESIRSKIEDNLLTESGFRLAMPWSDVISLLTEANVADAEKSLEILTARRLLSAEERNGVHLVELMHDLLIPEVVKSRNRRKRRSEVVASVERLVPAVAAYQRGSFSLVHHLRSAVAVRDAGAAEAVILYCARIQESMSADSLDMAGLPHCDNLFSNLLVVERYQLMRPDQLSWAHALRLLGNRIRHFDGAAKRQDAELALFCVERWLDWFFRSFRYGELRKDLTSDGAPLRLCPVTDIDDLLAIINNLWTGAECSAAEILAMGKRVDFETPVIPALLADGMLQRGWAEEARQLLTAAIERHPDDLRLAQLLALALSRQGELDKARECLEPLYERQRDDDEVASTLAEVYKCMWHTNPQRRKLLERAHAIYRNAWEREKSNAYLGVNAAATALWLDRTSLARRLAEEVNNLLTSLAEVLRRQVDDPQVAFNYWNQVAQAEALLLMGRLAEARSLYRAAFAEHKSQTQSIQSARKQAAETLAYLGIGASDTWLDADRGRASAAAVRVGVAGHRSPVRDDALGRQVRAVLERICRSGVPGRGPDFVVRSALAEGSDRLVAEIALGEPLCAHLDVILPLELSEYVQDFGSPESLERFRQLLGCADVISFPPPRQEDSSKARRADAAAKAEHRATDEERLAGYRWAGHDVVDRADVLLAIWDGQPARRGGDTAEIVAYARQLGRPLALIDARPPYDVRYERIS